MLLNQSPVFSAAAAAGIALELYGIRAAASALPSERDQNFLLETPAGERFVLKLANASEERTILEAQNAAMARVADRTCRLRGTALCPRVMPNAAGQTIVAYPGPSARHFVRLLTWIPGVPLGALRRHSPALLEDIGRRIGEVDRALAGFDHPAIHREFPWDLVKAVCVVQEHATRIAEPDRRAQLERWAADSAHHLAALLPGLRRSAVHNDANDFNVLVARGAATAPGDERVTGLIDFGDMVHSVTVADLAVAVAYAVLDKADPLAAAAAIVRGYHTTSPLKEAELAAILDLVRLRLFTSIAMAAHQQAQRPDDPYLAISQQPIARTLPRLMAIHRRIAEATFRAVCGLDPVPTSTRISQWIETRATPGGMVAMDPAHTMVLDLSVGSPLIAGDPADNAEAALTPRVAAAMAEAGATVALGRYGEPRMLYSSSLFGPSRVRLKPDTTCDAAPPGPGDADEERRTIHIGVDVFAPVGTAIAAPLAGVIHAAGDNAAPLDYGPVIILRHETDQGDPFYTLYGHLTRESLASATPGRRVAAGEAFAAIGAADVNGGWTPHLHFQVITDLVDMGLDFPGVCRPSQHAIWKALSPNPQPFVRVQGVAFPTRALETSAAVAERRRRIGRNVRLGYRDPVKAVRGWMQYLYDQSGRRYLDAYNNVPHVGHCHPRIVRAVSEQMRVLNTNTRYLHDSLTRLAAQLTATLPDPLRLCYFVSSGSEANELALRLARAHTQARDLIVLEGAYHGNTTTLVDVSHYKFAGPGGQGAPPWVHVAPVPDVYRGRFKADDPEAGRKYAADVADAAAAVRDAGRGLCAFLAESVPSAAGQIVPPAGYLEEVYAAVRSAGGVCIADEVQTAYGRMGTHFYAFEAQGVVPDIVVLGKPIGNGYPLGAVVTRAEIAGTFDNGMEFFSTFGGSTVSCAAGLAVLDVVQEEGLQDHARQVGDRLLANLRSISPHHAIIGDVRGSGFFIGVELVTDRDLLTPATLEASFVVNRLREEGILIGTEGPSQNVLKIRPPMPFRMADADRLVETLDRVLGELSPKV